MKFGNVLLNKFCVALLALTVLVAIPSCATTYTPETIEDSAPSWDGNQQNSGVIDYVDGRGFLITPNAADRYTALTEMYGKESVPPLKKGEGLLKEGSNFLLPNQYMVQFMELSRKHKNKIDNE